jgi:glycosyltransferase involved in cell wall biosynthesis
MLRVVHVCPYFPPHLGGLQNHVDILTREQAAMGLGVGVVTSSFGSRPGEENDGDGRRVLRLPSLRLGSDVLTIGLLRMLLVDMEGYDLAHLHGHMFFSTTLGAFANRLTSRTPTVFTFHGDYEKLTALGQLSKRVRDSTQGPFILRSVDSIITLTKHDREFLTAQGADPACITVIPNGVPLGTFRPLPAAEVDAFRARAGIPEGARVVLFVGRLVDQKGILYLINAAPEVIRAVPQARFLVVGQGHDLPRMRRLAKDLGVGGSVDFMGFLPTEDLVAAYNLSSVVAVPSLWEGMPLVILEASACGRPVVASAISGIPEFVDQGRTGLVVPPRDPGALARAIISIIGDGENARAMGPAALAKARAEFDLGLQVRRTVELYRSVVEANGR